jgi:hypothetical protein
MKPVFPIVALCLAAASCSKTSPPSPGASPAPSASASTPAAAANPSAPPPPAPEATSAPHPYEVKSGIMQVTNSMIDGMKQTIYFDDYGARRATVSVTDMKMMGQTIHSEKVETDDGGYKIDYDPVKKTGSRRKMTGGMPHQAGAPAIDVKKLTDDMKKSMNVHELPDKTIAGKLASGYEMDAMGMKVKGWTWKGLPLYSETGGLGKGPPIIVQVSSLQTDVPVPADKFVVPPDVTLKDF